MPETALTVLEWQRAGRWEESLLLAERLSLSHPRDADLPHLAGMAASMLGEHERAVAHLGIALARRPDEPLFLANLGLVLSRAGKHEAAISALEQSLANAPAQPGVLFNLGNALSAVGRHGDAVRAYQRALQLNPDYPKAWLNLASAHRELGDFTAARQTLERALQLRPDYALAQNNLANLLRECGEPEAARALGEALTRRHPEDAHAWNNLGSALRECGQPDAALAAYRQALALKPEHPATHLNLAMALLARGEYDEGWREYEWRWEAARENPEARRDYPGRLWRGEPIAGELILLHAEQGLGDALQFVRYAPLVAARGARVWLECQPELRRLFARLPGIERVYEPDQAPPEYAWHCPFMSLPLAFATRLATIPAATPYLQPDPKAVTLWRERLAHLPGPRIGLVWAGNPRRHDPVSHLIDRRRSLSPEHFARLLGVPGASFVSLQKDGAPAPGVYDAMAGIGDFHDTAALVANLDLIIAVDTSVAHLAGALGRPVWLLSRFDACWRWLENRNDSPWYPGMRLFRQPIYGDWDSVIRDVASALAVWLATPENPEALALAARGLELARAGQAEAAVTHYRRALALAPEQAAIWFNLGNLLGDLGQADAAEHALRQAIARQPGYVKARINLANLLRGDAGRDEAIDLLRGVLADDPNHGNARCNLGLVLNDAGRTEEALRVLQPLIDAQTAAAAPWEHYGVVLHHAGRARDAAAAFREALAREPRRLTAWCNLAGAELAQVDAAPGRLAAAIEAGERAVAVAPDQARSWRALAAALSKAEDLGGAEQASRRARELSPDDPEAHNEYGVALRALGRFEEAIAACRRALELEPDRPDALDNLAAALWESGQPDAVIEICEHLVSLGRAGTETWNSLGIARQLKRDLVGAEAAFRHALDLDPEHAPAHMNLALVLLTLGRYPEGWSEYEWRWQGSEAGRKSRRHADLPQWRGENPAGKRILLHSEQGLGDALQFIRYAPLVARAGARVLVECYPQLVRLFQGVAGVAEIIPLGQPIPPVDWQCPLMSLPLACATTLDNLPADLPYLRPDPIAAAAWGKRLAAWPGRKVGLVWAGNPRPHDPVSHRIDHRRSLSLARLAPLLARPGITLVSLQVGALAGQARGTPVLDFSAELEDFADTAALASQLDLIIAVDTSTAHLAGGMGRPVWLLSRFDACWRWLDGRDDSPWYPGMRLFRQPAFGDWDSVIEEVDRALATWADSR